MHKCIWFNFLVWIISVIHYAKKVKITSFPHHQSLILTKNVKLNGKIIAKPCVTFFRYLQNQKHFKHFFFPFNQVMIQNNKKKLWVSVTFPSWELHIIDIKSESSYVELMKPKTEREPIITVLDCLSRSVRRAVVSAYEKHQKKKMLWIFLMITNIVTFNLCWTQSKKGFLHVFSVPASVILVACKNGVANPSLPIISDLCLKDNEKLEAWWTDVF